MLFFGSAAREAITHLLNLTDIRYPTIVWIHNLGINIVNVVT